ncbi:MAG TPA: selenocysteine-specific translation elongation factor [Acidimicrobiales bacterium]
MHVVATAGHVDHGKSSLVLALTGTDPDRFAEEKRRGLTIDLGFAHTVLPSGAGISFVDVPGHVRFLKNMLAGVGAVDACLFVVAATEGWKPQSEEHLRILELVGVRHGIVALTKVDVVDDEHSEIARLDIADHVSGTFLDGAPIVGVAAPTGRGLDDLRAALDDLLLATPVAADRDRARLWVDRAFAARGAGTIVTGTLAGGWVAEGDRLVLGPRRIPVRVRAIQSLGVTHERIGPGNRVTLNLTGVELGDVERGDAVVAPSRWRHTTRFDASLHVLPALDHDVSRRGAYVAYIGSGEHPVRLRVLGAEAIPPGGEAAVRVHLPTALPLLPGDRFVLRESGRSETVGGGEVLDVAPVLPASRARPDRSVERVVAERRWVAAAELELLTGVRRPPDLGRWVAAPGVVEAVVAAVDERVRAAGDLGLDLASLDERERLALARLDDVEVLGGRARLRAAADPLAAHPFVAALAAGGASPPAADGVDRAELRELVRRGLVVERDGCWFHPDAVDHASLVAARLLAAKPGGFTMSELRDALGTTRKHALPLAAELDARGVTRRRGEVRIAGPRLPTVA